MDPFDHRGNVEAVFVVESAMNIGDPDDFLFRFAQEHRGHRADVAEALDHDAAFFAFHAQLLDCLVADEVDAAPGGFATSARATKIQRLAGYDGGDWGPHVHRVGIHHPCHDFFIRAEIGSGNVALGANPIGEFSGVAASHALEFLLGHFLRIANDSALRAAEGNVHHGAFPGHPGRECAHFIERDVRRIADPTFAGTSNQRMLHAIASKYFEPAIIHSYGNVDCNFFVWKSEVAVEIVFQA